MTRAKMAAGIAGIAALTAGAIVGTTGAGAPAGDALSNHARSAVANAPTTLAPDSVENLGVAPSGEELLVARTAAEGLACFLVVDPPDTPLAGVSMTCGDPAQMARRGTQIWRDNADGSISLWALAGVAADGARRGTVRFGSSTVRSTATGVMSARVPAGVRSIEVTGPAGTEDVPVPGR